MLNFVVSMQERFSSDRCVHLLYCSVSISELHESEVANFAVSLQAITGPHLSSMLG